MSTKTFKINGTTWRLGTQCGIKRQSKKGNFYAAKPADDAAAASATRKILRCKKRLLKKKKMELKKKEKIKKKKEKELKKKKERKMKKKTKKKMKRIRHKPELDFDSDTESELDSPRLREQLIKKKKKEKELKKKKVKKKMKKKMKRIRQKPELGFDSDTESEFDSPRLLEQLIKKKVLKKKKKKHAKKKVLKKKKKKQAKKKVLKKKKKKPVTVAKVSIVSMIKTSIKKADEELKKFIETATECDGVEFDERLDHCFKKYIEPILNVRLAKNTLFDRDSDGEYIVLVDTMDLLEKIEDCVKRRMHVCAIDSDHPGLDRLDEILESLVNEWIDEKETELKEEALEKFVDPMAEAVSWVLSIADRLPTVTLVRTRLGDSAAESYRGCLENLEDSPIDEFRIEPEFLKGSLMNTVTMNFKVMAICLMASGDKTRIMDEWENYIANKKKKKKAAHKKAAHKKKKG